MEPLEIAIPLAVAFLTALALSVPAGALARLAGALDRPSARGVNLRPDMPLWGGLAVAAAFGLAVLATLAFSDLASQAPHYRTVLAGGALIR